MKDFFKKHRILAILLALSALLLTQYKAVMPFVYYVVSSDLFLVDSNDKASQLPISNDMTNLAFTICNDNIRAKIGNNQITFPPKPSNSWSFGNYQYLISSEYTITDQSTNQLTTKKYTCRITYKNGDDLSGSNNPENWSLDGIDGI